MQGGRDGGDPVICEEDSSQSAKQWDVAQDGYGVVCEIYSIVLILQDEKVSTE